MKGNGLFTFLTGALVGAGITWLLTSEDGKELIARWRNRGQEAAGDLEKQYTDLQEALEELQNELTAEA